MALSDVLLERILELCLRFLWTSILSQQECAVAQRALVHHGLTVDWNVVNKVWLSPHGGRKTRFFTCLMHSSCCLQGTGTIDGSSILV